MEESTVNIGESVDKINEQISDLNRSLQAQTKEDTEKKQEEKPEQQTEPVKLLSESGIDYRIHPLFLEVAGYFGIKQKEYLFSVNKIVEICDWAMEETNSNNTSDVLKKIAETTKNLQSPGYGERRYAILYRYIKLARDKNALNKAINQVVDVEKLKRKEEDINKAMRAYQA